MQDHAMPKYIVKAYPPRAKRHAPRSQPAPGHYPAASQTRQWRTEPPQLRHRSPVCQTATPYCPARPHQHPLRSQRCEAARPRSVWAAELAEEASLTARSDAARCRTTSRQPRTARRCKLAIHSCNASLCTQDGSKSERRCDCAHRQCEEIKTF
jgi:hypothetical protein